MKKVKIIAAAALSAMAFTTFSLLVHGDALVYDSSNDPLVSLSYINDVVVAGYEKKLTALTGQITNLQAKLTELETKLGSTSGTASDGYTVVYLTKGAKLMADSTCELILRSGSAIAVSITINGLNDITDGTEILNAGAIPLYHALLVPRGGDGRGIQITSDEAYIMVRGAYQIVQ